MGYKEAEDDATGSFPESGAIFMCNRATKEECMKHRIFGLPLAQADFVKQVKAGMALFLFEFQQRKLYGAFRATSDGGIDVIPDAFKSSRKEYPAQVQFTQILNCSPLSEREFKVAIRDNYYSGNKFRFGLSKDQVRKLLLLFRSKELKTELPERGFARERRIPKGRRQPDDARTLINVKKMGLEQDMRRGLGPEIDSERDWNSLDKVSSLDHRMLSSRDTQQSKNINDFDQEQSTQTHTGKPRIKRTRIDSESSFLVNDVTEEVLYDSHSTRKKMSSEYSESLHAGRIMDEGLFSAGHMVKDEGKLGQIVARDNIRNSLSGAGVANKEGYWLNDNRTDVGSAQISTEHYGNSMIDNFGGQNQHDVDIDHEREYQRSAIDSDTYFLNNRNSYGPDMSTEHMRISMGRVTRATDDIRLPMIENDHERNILAEPTFGIARNSTDVRIYPTRERVKNEYGADGTHGLAASTDYSWVDLVEDRLIGGENRVRESDRDETGSQFGSFPGHLNISPSSISKSTYSGNPRLQTEISSPLGEPRSSLFRCPESRYALHIPRSLSQGVTRTIPDSEIPDINYGYSSPIAVGGSSSPDHGLPFYQGSKMSPSPSRMRESPPLQLEPRGSRRYFDTPCLGDTHSLSTHQDPFYRTINDSAMDEYSENSKFKTSKQEHFNGSFYSDSSAHIPSLKVKTAENDCDGTLTNSYFANLKRQYDAGNHNYRASERTNTEGLLSSDVGRGKVKNEASFSEARARVLPRKETIDQDNNFSPSRENKGSNKNNKRLSVFSRLASAPESQTHDQDDDFDAVDNENDINASVEKIMDTLYHGPGHKAKIRNIEVNLKRDNKGIMNSKKTIRATSDQEFEHSKSNMNSKKTFKATSDQEFEHSKPNMELGLNQTKEEIGGSILEETRRVDFKRRSKRKKTTEGTCSQSSAGVAQCKQLVGDIEIECFGGKGSIGSAKVDGLTVNSSKRKRLVRPVFGKKELDEGINFGVSENLQSPVRENSLKGKESICEEATEGCGSSNQLADPGSQKTAEAEKSSGSKSKEIPLNLHSPSLRPEEECKNYQPEEHKLSMADSFTNDSNCCGWIED